MHEWYETDSIDWKVYWEMIDTLDSIIKEHRNPKNKTKGGWHWPKPDYSAPKIFRDRFNADGEVVKSIREIAQNHRIAVKNVEQFISGIILSMLRRMNHPLRRRKWDLNMKSKQKTFA